MTPRFAARRIRRTAVIAGPAMALGLITAVPPALAAGRPAAASPAWRVVRTIAVKNTSLFDAVGFAGRSLWSGGEAPAQTPVLYHLASGTWHSFPLAGQTGTFVTGVSATTQTNVWASLANEPDVARLTSGGWVLQPFVSGTDQVGVDGVVTTGPKNTWAFTYDFVTQQTKAEHFTGTTWKATVLPAEVDGGSLTGLVSASGPANIWTWAYNPATKRPATLHYDGSQWVIRSIPTGLVPSGQSLDPKQILALAPDNVWATANNNMATGAIILLHWNGRSWARISGKLPTGELAGPIASDGSGGLWLEAHSATFAYYLLHYAHGTWTKVSLPHDSAGPIQLYSLRQIPGTTTVVGAGVVGQNPGGTAGAVIVRYS